jgi:hypothetical protein
VLDTVQEATPIADELIKVATIGVQAAEQLKNTGKIGGNAEALNYAIDFVTGWSPALASLENEKIIAAIESAVLITNVISEQLNKVEGANPPPHGIGPFHE